MEVSSEVSPKALLDLWGINDDDIKRYRICGKLNDPRTIDARTNPLSCSLYKPRYKQTDANYLCSNRKMDVPSNLELGGDGAQHKFEAPTGISEESDEETDLCKRYLPIQLVKSDTNEPSNEYSQLVGQDRSELQNKVICDWCNYVNELKLSWCENCGRVINNKDQQYGSCKDALNSDTQDSSYYGNTQANMTSLGCLGHTKTRKCTKLQARCDSYQRHWKKSSYYLWMKPSSSIVLVNDEVAGLKHERIKGWRRMSTGSDVVICALPDEVLLRIFSYLPWSSLLVCLLTCRRLNMIATDSSLWRDIELWKINDSILRCVAKRKPIRLTLKYCSTKLTASCLKECFAAIGEKLQYLKIDCCVFGDDYQLLTTVGVVCPHLQVLYLDHVIINVSILQHVVNNCAQLKDLTLIGTGVTMLAISHWQHCRGDKLSSIKINIIQ